MDNDCSEIISQLSSLVVLNLSQNRLSEVGVTALKAGAMLPFYSNTNLEFVEKLQQQEQQLIRAKQMNPTGRELPDPTGKKKEK